MLPRCYTPHFRETAAVKEIHIFCDSSEQSYGAVVYLHTEFSTGKLHVSFLLAKSRVAPKKQLSIPQLELCAALVGAKLSAVLHVELTIPVQRNILWKPIKP